MRASLIVVAIVAVLIAGNRAATPKPVWPTQFDVAFTLSVEPDISPYYTEPIVNASAHFYYNWEANGTLITYPEACIPGFLPVKKNFGCSLLFNSVGCYVLAPEVGVPCCLLIPGVGVVPPDFLTPFNSTGYQLPAADMNGVLHPTNFWQAAPFYYWTDVNTQQDTYFVDGGVIAWAFSPNFNVVPQASSLFTVPNGCASSCPSTELTHRKYGLGVALAHHRR